MSVNGFTFGTDPTIQKYNYESLDNIPDIENGTYPNMAVGSLIGENKVTDKDPYFLRPSASIGDREFDTLVGGTLGWNQLANVNGDSDWIGSNVTKSYSNGIETMTATSSNGYIYTRSSVAAGHRYLFKVEIKLTTATGSIDINAYGGSAKYCAPITDWQVVGIVTDAIASASNYFRWGIRDDRESDWDAVQVKNAQVIDLTTLFGSTIADYVYSLETATAGAGVAWVRKYLPNTYYAYCAPTLKHVSGVSAHVMTGFNQWDEKWEVGSISTSDGSPEVSTQTIRSKNFCRCLPNATYFIKCGDYTDIFYLAVFWYDADKNFIRREYTSGTTDVSPSNAHYFKIVTNPNNFVYGNVYNHDICINLSDASKNGTYEPYESHTYPIDSTWVGMGIPKLDSANKLYFDGDRYASDGTVTERFGIRAYQSGDESLADAITDGTNTVYKLTTPTTSTASPYTSPQICDPDGTEEYVTTGLVPVGHETEYVENLADKLTNIPDLPTTAGTYRLKVTVSGGVPSYSWVTT